MSGPTHPQTLTLDQYQIPKGHSLRKAPFALGALGIAGFAATAWGISQAGAEAPRFVAAWLVAFLFCLSLSLGSLFFVLVQFAARAGWSVVLRRWAENTMAAMPMLLFLAIPVFVHTHDLFHWTHPEAMADPLLKWKSGYLNLPFFYVRAAFYFAAWIGLALYFWSRSVAQDSSGDHAITRKLQAFSGPGILLFAITITFAAFDWIMSLDPHWYSTIFGVYYFAGSLVGAYAFMILGIMTLQAAGRLKGVVTLEHFHDLGKLLFGFTVFWSYIAFSQYFLIWYANIPEETVWYAHRQEGSWLNITIALAVGHFVIPFFFLLPRTIKRTPALLCLGALWMLGVHYLDLYWLVMPNFQHHGAHFEWVDAAALAGAGGLFLAVVVGLVGTRALIPHRDPRLPESISFENF